MAKRKKTKYNNGGLVSQTFKTNVADLNLNYEPPSQRYSADVDTGNLRVGVQGRGLNSPSSVHGSANIKGTNIQGSYNFKSKQPNVTITKHLSPTSNVQVNYGGKRSRGGTGITAMYNKSFSFGN